MFKGIAPQGPFLLSPRELCQLKQDISLEEVKSLVQELWGTKNNYFLSSGRACFLTLLQALQKHVGNQKNKVIIPAYTCPSVPFTIHKAGLEVVLCEIKDESFSFDEDHLVRLIDDRVLAVVPTHLFGIPASVTAIRQLLGTKQAFIVEDCSHAIGAWLGTKRVGTLGDVAFSSLGRGKLLTTGEGGMLQVVSEGLFSFIEETLSSLEIIPGPPDVSLKLRLALLHFVIARSNWDLIRRSPLDPERRERRYDFQVSGLSRFQIALLKRNLECMDDFNQERVKRAEVLTDSLSNLDGIRIPHIPPEAKPVFMMYPLIFQDQERMKRIYRNMVLKGYGCSRMYKSSLNVVLSGNFSNQGDHFPQTEGIAKGLITLPCHPYVSPSSLEEMAETIIQS